MNPYFYHSFNGMPVLMMAVNMLSMLVSMGLTALLFISRWFLFKKMGMPGWKGIIPFYSDYVLFRTLWNVKAFWAYITGMIVFIVLYSFSMVVWVTGVIYLSTTGMEPNAGILIPFFVFLGVIVVAFMVYEFIIVFKLYRRLAGAFGKSTGFAAGLTFLTPVFFPILAFGKAQYRGAPPQQ